MKEIAAVTGCKNGGEINFIASASVYNVKEWFVGAVKVSGRVDESDIRPEVNVPRVRYGSMSGRDEEESMLKLN